MSLWNFAQLRNKLKVPHSLSVKDKVTAQEHVIFLCEFRPSSIQNFKMNIFECSGKNLIQITKQMFIFFLFVANRAYFI